MKLLLMASLILLFSCNPSSRKNGKSIFRLQQDLKSKPISINQMNQYGVSFKVISNYYWGDEWIEIHCTETPGISNDTKVQVLENIREQRASLTIGGRIIDRYTIARLTHQAIRTLQWEQNSTRCPDRILASEL